MSNYSLNTRIIDLTLGELLEAVENRVKQLQADTSTEPTKGDKNFVYGLKGLAKLLGCSKTTAARLKATGNYDEAITQIGALLIIDADKVLEIAKRLNEHHHPNF